MQIDCWRWAVLICPKRQAKGVFVGAADRNCALEVMSERPKAVALLLRYALGENAIAVGPAGSAFKTGTKGGRRTAG